MHIPDHLEVPDEWNGSHAITDGWESLPNTVERAPAFSRQPTPASSRRAALPRAGTPHRRLPEALDPPQDFSKAAPAYAALPKVEQGSRAAARRAKAPCKRAAFLDPTAVQRSEDWITAKSRSPLSDRLKLRLSLCAGLRAGEIAALPLSAMLDASRRIADKIEIYASKTNHTRRVAMHPLVADALREILVNHPGATHASFSIGNGGVIKRQSASCVTNWFGRLYRSAGLVGCSSHSGRRTFATLASRHCGAGQGSIKDLQISLGHANLSSTQCYLEPSSGFDELIRNLRFTSPSAPAEPRRERVKARGASLESPPREIRRLVGSSNSPPNDFR